ncbi:hypothetical protein KH990_05600 [Methanoculleus bourgensis]|uniref:Uncharacterized protein n=1 Tax=Methanoculleus bourgensis TaxID=83986 RepID=A0A7K4C1W5_9EURY|nr:MULTISPECIES: hypothetical protein [Methanoculleus]MBT0732841.1 hypothetical protein [Methanoculleus bourgensis]NMA88132.1 hypothetical protein [Methanoculleus bourgensis]NMC89811.1 hypothetical protein [Methanomicrobiales archaeon]NQS79359.1 hypothetical protein [Methanoculleus bourgensis]
MERTAFTTFACLVERAARHPTIVRRNQMRKVAYTSTREPGNRIYS